MRGVSLRTAFNLFCEGDLDPVSAAVLELATLEFEAGTSFSSASDLVLFR